MTISAMGTDHLSMESPLGDLLLIASPAGVLRLAFDDENWDDQISSLQERTTRDGPGDPLGTVDTDPRDHLRLAQGELDQYFAGGRRNFDVPVDLSLTHGFTRRALEYLRTTAYGSVTSYGQVAEAIGSPRAARAVGSACSHNPVPVLVPCHRVLTASGHVGGYLGGATRKRFLLQLESDNTAMHRSERRTGGRRSRTDRRVAP